MDGFRFDPTVSLGSLLVMFSFLLTGVTVYTRLVARLSIIESRVGDLWKDFMDRKHLSGRLPS